jgi:hypothetical protein
MSVNFKKVRFGCYALGKIVGLDQGEKIPARELRILEKLESQETPLTDIEQEYMIDLKRQRGLAEKTLSKTCINYLREELFIYHTYGQRIRPGGESMSESNSRIMKGTLCESFAVELLSRHDGINYKKNEKKYRNKWVVGIPDINHKKRLGDRTVIDIKSSWDMYTFMNNLPKKLAPTHNHQVQGYISLTKADVGEVCHVLVSAPEELIEKQVAKLRYKNVFATREELEIAEEMTRRSMRFDDIPEENRIIRFPVIRNEEQQQELFERVDLCREWLVEYQKTHNEYFKK